MDYLGRRKFPTGGNLTEELKQYFDPSSETAFDLSKILYTCNETNQLIQEEVWEFDYEKFMMAQTWLYSYSYDSDGSLAEQVDKFWEGVGKKGTNSWSNDMKYVREYNKDFNFSDIAGPYWFLEADNPNLNHMPVSETDYVYVDGDWALDYRQEGYYSDFDSSTDINETQESQIRVYPFPAAEQLTFSWEESYGSLNLQLYDLTGKLVISRSIGNNEIIGVDQLQGGIYLYKLIDNSDLIHSGKISIE